VTSELVLRNALIRELGFSQLSVRVLEDNISAVQLSLGTGKLKSGHFRRMVAYLEGLTDRGILWLDHTPSKENPSDIMTKSVSPADQFFRMRDVINGTTPVLFVSNRVQEICQSTYSTSISCNLVFFVLTQWEEIWVRIPDLCVGDSNGRVIHRLM